MMIGGGSGMKADLKKPNWRDIEKARTAFEEYEPRDLFYRVATVLIEQAIEGSLELSIADAVAALLQTWNQSYYRYHKFDGTHFAEIERIIEEHPEVITDLRQRQIGSLKASDEPQIVSVFTDFEEVLGPVGAAKCLHLLAPDFFPLWDRAIAKAYGVYLGPRGKNGKKYYGFTEATRTQVLRLRKEHKSKKHLIKAVDEFNYCRYTLGVI
jgi:hypothetical protein